MGAILVVMFIFSMISIYYMQSQDEKNLEGFEPLLTTEDEEEKQI